MAYEELRNSGFVFALDIGTRSVMGILGKKSNDKIHIEHMVIEFHTKRAMLNGQIHDIDGVIEVVRKVKLALEKKANCTLDEVSIAAAGRSLKTDRITIEREIDPLKEIHQDLINSLEIEGLQKAQYEIEKQSEESTKYFCVGHTVVRYYINDGMILNPLGQKGNKVKLDILATFLPQMVVDSLYAVTSKLNLEVRYMTLEPIAAIEVAIPENARLLNLALVDIGAGTSDVAITKEGTIVAYGMTTCAGDHITEEICKNYLLDFDAAEALKVNLNREKVQRFSDIVGIPYEISSEEMIHKIQPAIQHLANLISNCIVEQNGKSPSAVFLIGGGSQTPRLSKFIAENLEIPEERVVVRGIETVQNTVFMKEPIAGPECITPIGILAKSLNHQELDFIEIFINTQRFKLFQTKKLKIMDALVLAGYNPRDLIPKRGKSIEVTINGAQRILYGQYGEPAEILINGQRSNIGSSIKDGDLINISPAQEGAPAQYSLENMIPLENEIFVNGKSIPQIHQCKVNGEKPKMDDLLKDGDAVEYICLDTVLSLCAYLDIIHDGYTIKVNEEIASLHTKIVNKDRITLERKVEIAEEREEKNELKQEQGSNSDTIQCTEQSILIQCNGKPLQIPRKNCSNIFVDIFEHIDFDRSAVRGKLVLNLNGNEASYTDLIETGDEIHIYWDK